MLTIYSKNNCPFCVMAKNYLQSKNINFREINIEQDQDAMELMRQQGHRTVPQIYYQGRLFVQGGWTGLSKLTTEDIISEIQLRDSLADQTL
jgi:glutaredoxin